MTAQVDKVRDALQAVWPQVKDAIAEQIERAGKKRLSSMHRRIAEQTIWELDRAGRLKTSEEEAVVKAAIVWHQSYNGNKPEVEDDDLIEDVKLFETVAEHLQS